MRDACGPESRTASDARLHGFRFGSQGIRPQALCPIRHFGDRFCKQFGIRSADMKHIQAFAAESDFIQYGFCVGHPFRCSEISFQEMAVADLSTAHKDGIRSGFKSL